MKSHRKNCNILTHKHQVLPSTLGSKVKSPTNKSTERLNDWQRCNSFGNEVGSADLLLS